MHLRALRKLIFAIFLRMSCGSFSESGCVSDNSCAPYLALQKREDFKKLGCCNSFRADHLYKNNCCCVAYYYIADNETQSIRENTKYILLSAYAVAVLYVGYNMFEFYRAFLRSKRAKSAADFLQSRNFLLFLVSIISLACGACAAIFHGRCFACFGGRGDAACVGGSSPPAVRDFYTFVTFDSIAAVSFVFFKVCILQNCLRRVQIGLGDDVRKGRALSVLYTVVALLGCCCLSWIVIASVHHVAGQAYVDELQSDTLSLGNQSQRTALRFALYTTAALTMSLATLSALLYLFQTRHLLKGYLASLRARSLDRISVDAEDQSVTQAIVRNMRRLRLAVYLTSASFIGKTVIYIVLAAGYASSTAATQPNCPNIHELVSNTSKYLSAYLCDGNYNQRGLVLSRSMLGSPTLFPLTALFCDPFLMIISIFLITTRSHQRTDDKININGARVVAAVGSSVASVLGSPHAFASSLRPPSDQSPTQQLL